MSNSKFVYATYSRCTMQIEAMKGLVKLTILHEIDRPESKLIEAVCGGSSQVK